MKTNMYPLKLNIYLFVFLFAYPINIYSQTLTAEQIYKKVANTVVVIHAYDYSNELVKQGSGVVLNDKGYVVTNYHVLADCERLEILHNKEIVPYVDIIGIDVDKDILILKIEEKKFPAIKIGDSKKINIGQRVYAIGSPLGFENTISEGIISGLRSYNESQKNFIQITASISAGSSGGAVVNDKGELIGISTLTAIEGQNLNFAVPIDDVLAIKISSYSNNDAYKDFEWLNRGNDAYEAGNYKESIQYYEIFIKKYPNDFEAYINRGLANVCLGDFKVAIRDYNKAIDINPHYAFAFLCRGFAKKSLGDLRGAIQDYDIAIEINTNYADAYDYRGQAKCDLSDYQGAIQDYNKAIDINPNDWYWYYNRGIAKANLGDFKGAIQDYTKGIQIEPNSTPLYYNRGQVKYKLGDISGACLDWSKAGELGNDSAYDLIRKYCN